MSAASDKVTLELSITDSMQLFNSMDPAPFHARDLDPTVVEYIVDWAEEQPRQAALSLEVSLSEETLSDHDTKTLREALRESFRRRACQARRRAAGAWPAAQRGACSRTADGCPPVPSAGRGRW